MKSQHPSFSMLFWVAVSMYSTVGFATAYNPTSDLLSAFSSGCTNKGALTDISIGQSQSLSDIIKKIGEDPACAAITTALSGIQNSRDTLDQIRRNDLRAAKKASYEKQLQDLLALNQNGMVLTPPATSSNPNPVPTNLMTPDISTALAGSIATLKQQEISDNAYTPYENQLALQQGLDHVSQYGQNLAAALGTGADCFKSHPGLVGQIGAQVMSISSEFTTGIVGAALFTVGTVADQLFKSISTMVTNARINRNDRPLRVVALGCAIESIASTYCKAKDAETFASSIANDSEFDPSESKRWKGLTLLGMGLTNYQDWIRRVVAGSDAGSPSAAEEKSVPDITLTSLRAADRAAHAEIDKAQSLIDSSNGDPAKIQNYLTSLVERLVDVMNRKPGYGNANTNGSGSTASYNTPFYDFFSLNPSCMPKNFILTGSSTDSGMNSAGTACKTYSPSDYHFEDIKNNVAAAITQSEALIQKRKAQVSDDNPLAALALSENSGKAATLSAQAFLTEVKTYLANLTQEFEGQLEPYTLELIKDTQGRIDQTFSALKPEYTVTEASRPEPIPSGSPAPSPSTRPAKPIDRANAIQAILAPNSDSYFLVKSIQTILDWDIAKRIKDLKKPKSDPKDREKDSYDTAFLLKLAKEDGVSALLSRGLFNVQDVTNDAKSAQKISKNNLETVIRTFKGDLIKALKETKNDKDGYPVDLDSTISLCMQLVSVPNSAPPRLLKNIQKTCAGLKKLSVYKGSNILIDFDAEFKKSPDERMCAYYHFTQKTDLFSIQRNR